MTPAPWRRCDTDPSSEGAGVLLMRAWVEGDSPSGLRARITRTRDLASDERTSTVAATVDEVCQIVRVWLEELLDQRAGPR